MQKGASRICVEAQQAMVQNDINNVTLWSRFSGMVTAICAAQGVVLENARLQPPEQWIGGRVMRYEPTGSQ